MVQGYYTLEEAARILKMTNEELTQLAQKRQIRAFADRGTWRFRSQDVEEMARRRGQSSDEVLSLAAGPGDGPKAAQTEKHDVFDFNISPETADNLDLGGAAASPSAAKPGSDSDVKLVMDSDSSEFDVTGDGGLVAKTGDRPVKDSNKKTHIPESPSDSEVQLVPLDEPDALALDAPKPKTGSDSDVRLENDPAGKKSPKRAEDMPPTDEIKIDLDAELRKSETRGKAGSKSSPPAASPFELSESDLEVPAPAAKAKKSLDDSSDPDFDLSPSGSMDEISLSEIVLEEEDEKPTKSGGKKPAAPADSGLKLKDSDAGSPSSSGEIEFELSLDSDGGLEGDKGATVHDEEASSSSEFELTLDDSGGLAPLEDKPSESGETDIFETDLEVPALDEESGSEVVPLDESDTDLESSDFDFDPESSESGSQVVAIDDEADDAAATVARKSPPKGKKGRPVPESSSIAEIDEILTDDSGDASGIAELEDDEAAVEPLGARRAGAVVAAGPADWGIVPALAMLPCVLVMSVLAIMAFELLHDMWGYKQSYKPTGVLIRPISGMFADLPPDQ